MIDIIRECFVLGIDFIVLALCIREYVAAKRSLKCIENAKELNIDGKLKSELLKNKNKVYAMVRGLVKPLGQPLRSMTAPITTGVLQVIEHNEHYLAKVFGGFWSENNRIVNVVASSVPFELRNGQYAIEISDSFQATILHMDIISNTYTPASLTLIEHIMGFLGGYKQKGMCITERMLREGSFITAIGELELNNHKVTMKPSTLKPLFLTTATRSALIAKYKEITGKTIIKIAICGTISILLLHTILRKYLQKRKHDREKRMAEEMLERNRRNRRAMARPDNISTEYLCAVCTENPREIIFLPCGHLCVCEDCSERIEGNCPVCRSRIDSRSAAFL